MPEGLGEVAAGFRALAGSWIPGDPVYQDAPERGHCSSSACGTTWVPAGAEFCPECGAPAGPADSGATDA